ncbi:MAG: DUF4384 domain-containing protein [Methyloligellaceae bacterium]
MFSGRSFLKVEAIVLSVVSLFLFPASLAFADQLEALNKNAMSILDKHCSNCHQTGKGTGSFKDRPAGNFGFVLNTEKLISSNMIKPGLPNASSLFVKMESGEMPKGLSDKCNEIEIPEGTYCGPDARELKVVYKWIEQLKSKPIEVARKFVTNKEILAAMVADISKISEPIRPRIRYFVLTNLYNAGDSEKDLKGYRMALTKLVNSLSFQSDPASLVPVDENKTVFRVNIGDLGWTAQKWNAIAAHNPYALEYDDINFKTLQTASQAYQPFLRGDWFTYSASQPPLYHDILGLPDTKQELEKVLGLDVKENIKNLKVARAGFQKSGVSENNRMIERHSSRTGAYWESYDFAGNNERQSFFKYPLGPIDNRIPHSQKHGFEHDGGEIIFELPNGFHAYYLTDGKGKRIDKGPTPIVADPQRRDRAVTNGVSCMGCHDKGIKYNSHRPTKQQDQVREYIEKTNQLSFAARDVVMAIYPKHDEFFQIMEKDAQRYKSSLEKSGVTVGYNVGGLEVVNALFVRFEKDLDLKLGAAAFGMSEKEFTEVANRMGGEVFALKQRLMTGLVPRDQFISEFSKVVSMITRDKMAKHQYASFKVHEVSKVNGAHDNKNVATKKANLINVAPHEKSNTFNLIFYPNQSRFVKGQEVSFVVQSEKACYLTLLNIPEKGNTTVLFPNKFNQNNRIDAGVSYEIPGKLIKRFALRFGHSGAERVIAICNATRPDPIGISHNFRNQAYTTFENYEQVITRGFRDRKRTRQILIESDSGKSSSLKTDREKKLPALTTDKKHSNIEARKAVLLHVLEH